RASSEKESAVNAPLEQIEQQLSPDLPPAERLGILYSHPTWMVERWLQCFGAARTKALLETDNRPARVMCTLLDPAHAEGATSALREAGLSIEPGRMLGSAWSTRGGDPTDTEAFTASSSMPRVPGRARFRGTRRFAGAWARMI